MNELFSIKDKVTVISGGTGVLGGSLAMHFLKEGARVVLLGTKQEKVDAAVTELKNISQEVIGFECNVLDKTRLAEVSNAIVSNWGRIDILLNIAGGNMPKASLTAEQNFFDLNLEGWDEVTDLNIKGTVYPSQIFGLQMAAQESGVIINISSVSAVQAMTRVPGYSAAKAAVDNFTKWLATDMAIKYKGGIRVNSVRPGFFLGNQNRALLINPDGSLTERSNHIIHKTPMRRFGEIDELNGTVQFLCSEAAKFITGTIVDVDGGFGVFTGV